MSDRADWLYGKWLDATQGFDMFATGLNLAVVGYMASHLPPRPFERGLVAYGS